MARGLTNVSRIERLKVQLLRGLALLLVVLCSPGESRQKQVRPSAGTLLERRVRALQAEAKRIDAANEAEETAERRQLTKELPHWQFSGLFENSTPIFLNARLTEGQVVREESYYLRHGKPFLVRVEKWWDVEDESKAPEPTTRQDFYIDDDQTIRHVVKVESKPATSRTSDKARPAAAFAQRSHSIAQILLGGPSDASVTDPLLTFTEAELPPR